ncbi:MAG: ABC transporter permease [Actinobacteria bacterium HGW-Actinobacteria-1]|nr:MAG: ABC transporter permease [Actinobacteria bacterium HGW-Actinobacteria-1]
MTERSVQTRFDKVALVGAMVALAGATALPFVELRANRLVPGAAHSVAAAGPWAYLLWLLVGVGFLSAVAPTEKARAASSTASGYGLVVALAWGIGHAASTLLVGQPSAARVSLGAGVWVLLAGTAILGFSGGVERRRKLVRWAGPLVLTALAIAAAFAWGGLDRISLAREFAVRASSFWTLLGGHLAMAGTGLGFGLALGVPLGLWATRNRHVRSVVLGVTGVIQTVPSLALLGLLIAPLAALSQAVPALRALGVRGIGATPGLIALTLYALLPIVRNTYVGLAEVDPAVIDAGRGMGMSSWQLLWRVEFPLALPLIIEGVRTASVLLIGITTLTVFAGARNLGILVFEGLGQFAPDLILLGALPIIALAVVADVALSALGRALTPEGVRA